MHHLGLAELVVPTFVPVTLTVDRVEGKALAQGCRAPVGTLRQFDLVHVYPPKKLPDLPPQPLRAVAWLPKPPRVTEAEVAERDSLRLEPP
jgi:hypothetical protein